MISRSRRLNAICSIRLTGKFLPVISVIVNGKKLPGAAMADLDRRTLTAGLLASAALTGSASAQTFAVEPIVTAAADVLRAQYVDAQRGAELADFLLTRLRAGAYATSSRQHLAQLLTQDLQAQ